MADLIKIAEEAFATGIQMPTFKAGDTVTVAYKIVEGNKERVQLYRGVVIKIAGHGNKKRFTVRNSTTCATSLVSVLASVKSVLQSLRTRNKPLPLFCKASKKRPFFREWSLFCDNT